MNGKKLLLQKLMLLLILLVVVAAGAAVSFGKIKAPEMPEMRGPQRQRFPARTARPLWLPGRRQKIRNPRWKKIKPKQFT